MDSKPYNYLTYILDEIRKMGVFPETEEMDKLLPWSKDLPDEARTKYKKEIEPPKWAAYFDNTDDYLPLIMHSAATRLFLSWDRQVVTMASDQEKRAYGKLRRPSLLFWQV